MKKITWGGKSFWRNMVTLAIPIAIQNLLTSSFSLVDTMMVGRLGDVSLAAVGMAGQWSWLLNMLVFGICSGAAVFFAQFFGEGNKQGFRHTYGIALLTGLFCAFLFMAVGLFAPGAVIRIFNRDTRVVEIGIQYLKIAAFSYPAIMLNMLINMVLRSTKRVKLPVCISVFTTVLNAFLDYGLIFGAFGLPRLGVEGAAIATVVSAWSGPVILLIVMAFLRDDVFFAPWKALFGFRKDFAWHFFCRALPVILNETVWGLGTTCYNAIFANMGYEYSAAVSIHRTFENIAFAFFAGMINAASVQIGQDIGKGEIRQGIKNANRYMIAVPILGVILSMVIIPLRDILVSIFNAGGNISERTVQAARGCLLVYALELPVRNMAYVAIVGVFRPGGDTKKGMQYELPCLWALSVPMTFIAAFVIKLPFIAVFACSYICEDFLKTFLCIRHFKSKRWLKPVTDTGKAALKVFWQEEKHTKI